MTSITNSFFTTNSCIYYRYNNDFTFYYRYNNDLTFYILFDHNTFWVFCLRCQVLTWIICKLSSLYLCFQLICLCCIQILTDETLLKTHYTYLQAIKSKIITLFTYSVSITLSGCSIVYMCLASSMSRPVPPKLSTAHMSITLLVDPAYSETFMY